MGFEASKIPSDGDDDDCDIKLADMDESINDPAKEPNQEPKKSQSNHDLKIQPLIDNSAKLTPSISMMELSARGLIGY
jgi:hypothetical protein